MTSLPRTLLLRLALIIGATLWIYCPVFYGGFLWDDGLYITEIALMNDPARLWKTWFEPGSLANYFPITATVQWAEWILWGHHTLGYHLVNIGLHIVNALLIWRLLAAFGLRLAWLGGLIFAIHPTAVESVAWICELKNTLSLTPLLATMITWVDYEEKPNRGRYYLALAWFLLALLCKTTGVMFPVVILLYAWWKRSRITKHDLLTSAPFFGLSFVLGVITVYAEKHFYAMQDMQGPLPMGFASQVACSGMITVFYFWNSVWPTGLMPIYPKWDVAHPGFFLYLPWIMVTVLLLWLWMKRDTFGRHALLGLGFFLINLFPFMGFATSGYMTFTWAMDHFLYIPIIGIIGLAVALFDQIRSRVTLVALAVALASMAWESHTYARMFVDLDTLWTFAAATRDRDSAEAQERFGQVLLQHGRVKEAEPYLEKAARLRAEPLVGK